MRVVHVDAGFAERGEHLAGAVHATSGELVVRLRQLLDLGLQRQQVQAVLPEQRGPRCADVLDQLGEASSMPAARGELITLADAAARARSTSAIASMIASISTATNGIHRARPAAEQQALHLELEHELLEQLAHRPQLVGQILGGIHAGDGPALSGRCTDGAARRRSAATGWRTSGSSGRSSPVQRSAWIARHQETS